MAEETGLDEWLADLAADGRLGAVPLAAEQIRARGDRRRRRKRAARASGGVLLAAAVVVGGLSLVRPGPEPTAADPNPSTSAPLFVPPTPAPGEEYATELGYVYGAVALDGGRVRVTVQQLRDERGTAVPTGVVHELTLPAVTPVEVRDLAGGRRETCGWKRSWTGCGPGRGGRSRSTTTARAGFSRCGKRTG